MAPANVSQTLPVKMLLDVNVKAAADAAVTLEWFFRFAKMCEGSVQYVAFVGCVLAEEFETHRVIATRGSISLAARACVVPTSTGGRGFIPCEEDAICVSRYCPDTQIEETTLLTSGRGVCGGIDALIETAVMLSRTPWCRGLATKGSWAEEQHQLVEVNHPRRINDYSYTVCQYFDSNATVTVTPTVRYLVPHVCVDLPEEVLRGLLGAKPKAG